MDIFTIMMYGALTVLLATVSAITLVLAAIGYAQIRLEGSFNPPIIPEGSPGKSQQGKIITGTTTAEIKGDFVVFVIGMCVHNWWDVRAWWPVASGFQNIMKELQAHPESGYLGGHAYLGNPTMSVQYWRSFDALMDYARQPSALHFPIWVKMRTFMRTNKSFGIYHETYKVNAGQYECIYSNMPPFGLGGAMGHVLVEGRYHTAKGRVGQTKGDDHPADVPERLY